MTTDITVLNMTKQQKDGHWQVLGFRTSDALKRAVTFFVKRDEAEWLAKELRVAGKDAPVLVEIDRNAWAFVFSTGWLVGGAS